jgi:hypothetical protein
MYGAHDACRWDSPFPRTGRNLVCEFHYTKSIVGVSEPNFLHEARKKCAH